MKKLYVMRNISRWHFIVPVKHQRIPQGWVLNIHCQKNMFVILSNHCIVGVMLGVIHASIGFMWSVLAQQHLKLQMPSTLYVLDVRILA